MKKYILIVLIVLAFLLLCGCAQNPIITDVETSEAITESPETELFSAETTQTNPDIQPYIGFPLVYEETSNGLYIKVEFLKQELPATPATSITVNLTYKNLSNETINFDAAQPYVSGAFVRNDGENVYPRTSKKFEHLIRSGEVCGVTLEPGRVYSDRFIYQAGDFFDLKYTYAFSVKVETTGSKIAEVMIPIEIYEKDISDWYYNGTWYLSDWEFRLDNRAEDHSGYIKLPFVYEESVESAHFKVEFFREIYALNSYIQCRVSVTNNTGEDVKVRQKELFNHGGFVRDSKRDEMIPYSYCKDRHGFNEDDHGGYLNVAKGETYVIESVFIANVKAFEEGHEYAFIVEFCPIFSNGEQKTYSITIPVELCSLQAEST